MFGFDLVGRLYLFQDTLDGIHLAFDDLLKTQSQSHALLIGDWGGGRRGVGARLRACLCRHHSSGAVAQSPREMKRRSAGAAAAPAAFAHPPVEIRARKVEHAGDVVDRSQCLLVKALSFGKKFRRNLLFCCHIGLPQNKKRRQRRRKHAYRTVVSAASAAR